MNDDAEPQRLRAYLASAGDGPGLIALVQACLGHTPSSPLSPDEVGDPERRVWESLRRVAAGQGCIVVGVVGGTVVAAGRVLPKEFARSAHVAMAALVVAPAWRRRGVGRRMLGWMVEEPFVPPTAERVEMSVAESDLALRALLEAASWGLERVEQGGWMTPDGPKDLLIYVRDR